MLDLLPLEQISLCLLVLLHHNAINPTVTVVTQHKICRVLLPHDHQENTNPTGCAITSVPYKPVSILHIEASRQTSILLTQMWFCELSKKFSITLKWEKGCKLKGFMAVKYIFPEPIYRAGQRADRRCFASYTTLRFNTGNLVTSEEIRG